MKVLDDQEKRMAIAQRLHEVGHRLALPLVPHRVVHGLEKRTKFQWLRQVQQIIELTGADPRQLGLELTEGMVIDNIADTIEKMQALKQMEIELSIDDFGTGYSSLAYLKRLPLDIIKVDQSFVRDIQTDAGDAAIVEAIISMAHHLGLTVIAEGVETDFELDFLDQRECGCYQGYYFSRPVPEEEFTRILKTEKNLPLTKGCPL